MTTIQRYDCAYCPLGGIGAPVMVAGFPSHPSCAEGVAGMTEEQLERVRAEAAEGGSE